MCQAVPCLHPFSAAAFFEDSPWLNIPPSRRGEILIEPLYPRAGLLGGSSGNSGGKVSKLAALAAARKKKDVDDVGDRASRQQSASVTLLNRLGGSRSSKSSDETVTIGASDKDLKQESRRYQPRRKSPGPAPQMTKGSDQQVATQVQTETKPTNMQASPSLFAKTMLGGPNPTQPPGQPHIDLPLPYMTDVHSVELTVFTEPSPDDVVTNAQAKGAV